MAAGTRACLVAGWKHLYAMGMFDTIHTENGCGQTKCFGRLLADFYVGDAVTLRTMLTPVQHQELYDELAEEYASKGLVGSELQIAIANDPRSDALFAGQVSSETDYDVRMTHGGGFLHVRGGVIAGWDGEFDPSVRRFDSHGLPLGIAGAVGQVVEMTAERCSECSGEVPALRGLFDE